MFLLVTFHVFAVQSSFQLDKLERERSDAQRQNELLRNLVAKRSSATTISKLAAGFGMIAVTPVQVTVTASGVTVPNTSATPVTMPAQDYKALGSQQP